MLNILKSKFSADTVNDVNGLANTISQKRDIMYDSIIKLAFLDENDILDLQIDVKNILRLIIKFTDLEKRLTDKSKMPKMESFEEFMETYSPKDVILKNTTY